MYIQAQLKQTDEENVAVQKPQIGLWQWEDDQMPRLNDVFNPGLFQQPY